MSSRDHQEVQRGPERQPRHENHFEHRPNGLSGHEFTHGFQQMMRAEQRMFRHMEHELIRNGCLPPNPFMNGFDQDCGQPPAQPDQQKGGGDDGILGGIKKVAGVVGKVAMIASIL